MSQAGKNPQVKQASALRITLMHMVQGGLAGCIATSCVIPLDVTKTWMQLKSEEGAKNLKIGTALKSIYESKGWKGFYAGLDSALFRQFSFASIRVGLFFNIVDMFQTQKGRQLKLAEKAALSAIVGAFGAVVINPFNVVLVRSWADVKKPPAERRNYKNIFNGLARITKEEGLPVLWRGSTPNIYRAIAFNFGMMVPYFEAKERLSKYLGNGKLNYMISSIIAGITASICALPFDNVMVKLVNMKKNEKGVFPYKGVADCMMRTIKGEGIFRMWAGLIPFACNIAPHSIITLNMSELIWKIFKGAQWV